MQGVASGGQTADLQPVVEPAGKSVDLEQSALAAWEDRASGGGVPFGLEGGQQGQEVVEKQGLAVLVALAPNAQATVGEVKVGSSEGQQLRAAQAAGGQGERSGAFGRAARGGKHSRRLVRVRRPGDAAGRLGAVDVVRGVGLGVTELHGRLEEAGE